MKKYIPSNGTEGEGFMENYCYQCIHERWTHRMEEDLEEDKCDILSRTLMHGVNDPKYPTEWTYNENGKPVCTSWVKFDWGGPDNPNEPPELPSPPSDDPNQLLMPFDIWELLGINNDIVVTKHVITERSIL